MHPPGYPSGQYPGQPPVAWQPPPNDPLISADYGGWWRRSLAILRVAWPQLLILELIGAVIGTALQSPFAIILDRLPLRVDESLQSGELDFGLTDLLTG